MHKSTAKNWIGSKNPTVLFVLLILASSLYIQTSNGLKDTIRSDGRGYYGYLPAIFLFNDPSFTKSLEAEVEYTGNTNAPLHLVKTIDGGVHNKHFPGIAILQSPFFVLATITSWIAGQPIDGYSDIYSLFFLLGSLFYTALGYILFSKVLQAKFPDSKHIILWIVPFFYLATPLLHYAINTPGFSHAYSFFLFSWFAWTFLQLKKRKTPLSFFKTGLILGLIALVRPTNLTILLATPLLFSNFESFKSFISSLKLRSVLSAAIGFFLIVSLLFLVWKWESGNWIIWSYGGEGFTFLSPHFFNVLFSYRMGLFLHTPIILLSALSVVLFFKKDTYFSVSWMIYFVFNLWIIASWWSWDYESPFGNRPFIDHLPFLLLPIIPLLTYRKRMVFPIIAACSLLGFIRIWSYNTGYIVNQRFTEANYFSSLAIWKDYNHDRWNFTRSLKPHGELVSNTVLYHHPEILNVTPEMEFIYTVEGEMPKPRTNERYYYQLTLDKQTTEERFSDVYLVIDAQSKNGERYYTTVELFNDRYEGKDTWTPLVFEGIIHDNFQVFDKVGIYIWNLGHKTFSIKNAKLELQLYNS